MRPLDFAKMQLHVQILGLQNLQNLMAVYYSETYFFKKMFYGKMVHLQYWRS